MSTRPRSSWRVLGIPAPAYYSWPERRRRPARRALEDAVLLEKTKQIRACSESGDAYGSPRVHLGLRRQGVRCGRKRVERLMRGRRACTERSCARKGGPARQDRRHAPAPDLVRRNFRADAPSRLQVAGLARILTGEGVLWLAWLREAFSNRVAGWKTSDRAGTELVPGALEYALWSRGVRAGQLICHSGKGSQGEFN